MSGSRIVRQGLAAQDAKAALTTRASGLLGHAYVADPFNADGFVDPQPIVEHEAS